MQIVIIVVFLSTLSLRRATRVESGQRHLPRNFYPRSPCGERLVYALKLANAMLFLSTLSLRRATGEVFASKPRRVLFLSTLSLRRATINRVKRLLPSWISIHALLAESDQRQIEFERYSDISIHALLAESDHFALAHVVAWGISIHALLAESDACA